MQVASFVVIFNLSASPGSELNKNKHVGLCSHSILLFLDISVLFPDVLIFEHEEPGVDQALLLLLMKVTGPAVIVWKSKKKESEITQKTACCFLRPIPSNLQQLIKNIIKATDLNHVITLDLSDRGEFLILSDQFPILLPDSALVKKQRFLN